MFHRGLFVHSSMAVVVLAASSACAIGGDRPATRTSALATHTPSSPATSGTILTGMTAPHWTATLGAVMPGRIARIAVVEGQRVREGQLLVALDDRVQRMRTEIAHAASMSWLHIDLVRAKRQRAERDLERLAQLRGARSASERELADAKSAVTIARLELELAKFEREQAVREYHRQQFSLEQLAVRAPFAGYVAPLHKQVGEIVNEREDVVTVVQLDPLEVVVDAPLRFLPTLQIGDTVPVLPVGDAWTERKGTIVLVGPVADPASQTVRVKLTVANPEHGWIAGMKVRIHFFPTPGPPGASTRRESSSDAAVDTASRVVPNRRAETEEAHVR